jgi:ABC-2 type transport system permease protein
LTSWSLVLSPPPSCLSVAARPRAWPRTSSTASSTGSVRCPFPGRRSWRVEPWPDSGLLAWSLAVTTASGFAVGFRLHAGLGSSVAAFALGILFGFAFEWMFIMMGLMAGNAQAAQGMSMIVFPFTFVSSAYVPVSTMPSWLRPFAEHQPITAMVNAVRCLTEGPRVEALLHHSTGHYVVLSLLWTGGLIAVFAPVAIARFSHR